MTNIAFSPPDITDFEMQAIMNVLKSGWITTGSKTKEFEKKIAEYCGTSKAVCLNSATVALELVLRVLGVGPGDEVITSAYTYTASASVIHHVGAKIVLVDVAPGSYQMNYEKLSDAITAKTKVIIPVDIGGVMCDYDMLYAVLEAKRHLYTPSENPYQRLFDRPVVLADAAHSFGSIYHNHPCGLAADYTCFSFHAVKNLTTAEGGAITWQDRDGMDSSKMYDLFMLYALHGQSKDALAKLAPGSWEYDIIYPAWKCNMTDIAAAMGLVQLERFGDLMAKRKRFVRIYDAELNRLEIESLQHFINDGYEGNGHLYLTRLLGIKESCRNEIIVKMAQAGIACNVHFKPLPLLTAYKNLGFDIKNYPNAYSQYANEISLPLHTLLTDDQVSYVADVFGDIVSYV